MTDDLEKRFGRATAHVKLLARVLSQEQLLLLYGLYKQANFGCNNTAKPSFIRVTDRKKWEAWSSNKSKSEQEAKEEYIALVAELDPDFNADKEVNSSESTDGWVRVSSLARTEPTLADSEKTIFDWVKDGNEDKIRLSSGEALRAIDDNGMSLLHWAADRGLVNVTKLLLDAGLDPDFQDADGQTALHFAASCGHAEVARTLIAAGANPNAVDCDGCTPPDLEILLEKF